MKKKLLMMMLAVMLLLVACGNTDNKDTEANTQQTESPSTSETETLEADTEEETTTEVVNTEVESEAPTQTESEAPQPSEEPSEPETPTYTYTDLNKTMYAKSSVNVRSLPSTDGEKLGGLSKGQEVSVSGQCNETGWYRISYNGGVGYVSSNYLVDEKPVEETPTQPSEPSQPSEPEECPVTLNTIIDCGDYFYVWRCAHTQEDVGQHGIFIEADQYARNKWGNNFGTKGCNDHIKWNGYIVCQEVWYYVEQ